MLKNGIKAGELISEMAINKLITTAEQIANINVTGIIKAVSDADGTSLTNYIYQYQHRENLCLIGVFVSETAITPNSPKIIKVVDMNNNDLTSDFTVVSDSSESFNFMKNEKNYILYLAKKEYSVASSARTRIKISFDVIDASVKSLYNTKMNSVIAMQCNSSLTTINQVSENQVSDYNVINQIKDAFLNFKQSYNLSIEDDNGNIVSENDEILDLINNENDFLEFGIGQSNYLDLVDGLDDRMYIDMVITPGSEFNYGLVGSNGFTRLLESRGGDLSHKYKLAIIDSTGNFWEYGKIQYMDTMLEDTFIINSAAGDSLNSYDLFYLFKILNTRLMGMLINPIIGKSPITDIGTSASTNITVEIKNNISNSDFNNFFTISSGYKVYFNILNY